MQLNADFRRTVRREKKAFSEWCIKLEENTRRGKTRDLLGKTGDIKGIFCPKMGTRKDINGRGLVDKEEIKKRWKEYLEELYKKDLMNRTAAMVCSATQSQTFWRAKSSGPSEILLLIKLEDATEFQRTIQSPKG